MDVEAETGGSYALLTDGRCVLIRSATPRDWQFVHDFAAGLGRESIYHRFFGFPKYPGRLVADAVCSPAPEGMVRPRGALLALLDGAVVGLAEWIRAEDPAEAEIAFAVADRLQGHGVATLLAEHLLDEADRAGIHRFTAITQGENRAMLDVFAMLGVPMRKIWDHGTWMLSAELDLRGAERVALLDAAARRERAADEASLRHLLAPNSIAVVGDPQDAATAMLRWHLHGFTGRVSFAGPDGTDLPEDVTAELAVITSPPEAAVRAIRVCALRGVRAVVVTSTEFDDTTGRALLEACRAGGVRLLGPGSLGLVNTGVPGGLNASLAPGPFSVGPVGVAVQSGGVGLTILSHLARLGIGIGTFAAVGDKYDVSANDLLMHWQDDPAIRLGLLHVESFGNPRKFARTARALSRRIPLLAVDPEQSPSQARTALYAQAGITAVPSVGALVCAAALLAHQPAPRGRRVAVFGNTRGMVSLAVRSCIKAGLDVATALNLTPQAGSRRVAESVAAAAESGACDAVLVALAPTAPANTAEGLLPALSASGSAVPVVAVLADQPETVTVRHTPEGAGVPVYNDAATAVSALAVAATVAVVRERSDDLPPELEDIDTGAAALLVDECLKAAPHGRALTAAERAALLAAFGVIEEHTGTGRTALDGRRVTIIAWQDFVFGPLLTCARDGDSAAHTTLLVPAGLRDLTELARRVADAPSADEYETADNKDADRVTGTGMLADLLARVAVLVDELPQIASLRLETLLTDEGGVRVVGGEVNITPARRRDPYLRRLRRAPVE